MGGCFLILADGEPVGQVNYNDIHERDGRGGRNSTSGCGARRAVGRATAPTPWTPSAAISTSGSAWRSSWSTVCPNPRAIRAYEKAGFRRLDLPIEEARSLWGPNDYADSVYMVRAIPHEGNLAADAPKTRVIRRAALNGQPGSRPGIPTKTARRFP